MKIKLFLSGLLFSLIALWLTGCIHEHPVPTKGGVGETPGTAGVSVNVVYELSWETLIHNVDHLSTRAMLSGPHRFIVSVLKNGRTINRDVFYVNDEEFARGSVKRSLSHFFNTETYDITVWYDYQNGDEDFFEAGSSGEVEITRFTTDDVSSYQCAYGSEILDLRAYSGATSTVNIEKNIQLSLPGARFEIIATDVREFIEQQKEALNQGDRFNIELSFDNGAYSSFNLLTGSVTRMSGNITFSGRMRLPYADYDELKIAEGFIFCRPEDDAEVVLRVENSALVTVSQTGRFSFPVRRGFVTVVRGDFLTHPLDGVFNIDHLWEGEIYYEV